MRFSRRYSLISKHEGLIAEVEAVYALRKSGRPQGLRQIS